MARVPPHLPGLILALTFLAWALFDPSGKPGAAGSNLSRLGDQGPLRLPAQGSSDRAPSPGDGLEPLELLDWRAIGPFALPASLPQDGVLSSVERPIVDVLSKGVGPGAVYGASQRAWQRRPEWTGGRELRLTGERCVNYARRAIYSDGPRVVRVIAAGGDEVRVWANGEVVCPLVRSEECSLSLQTGWNELLVEVVDFAEAGEVTFELRRGRSIGDVGVVSRAGGSD